jgi:L,D-peptidoglycan transpeptidase YkuD (ErfK/YbiS/YcfS/YnhG family)
MRKLLHILLFILLWFHAMHGYAAVCSLHFEGKKYACSIGRAGIISAQQKQEGDGATPDGDYPLRKVFYRPDRVSSAQLKTLLPHIAIEKNMAWCDDIKAAEYNQEIQLPFKGSYEPLWLQDHVYDIDVVIGYNDYPIVLGKGSAIFLHIARDNYTATAGCIALSREDLLAILAKLKPNTYIKIQQDGNIYIN